MDFLHKVEAIVVLDNEGNRICSRYYPVAEVKSVAPTTSKSTDPKGIEVPRAVWGTLEKQIALEKGIHGKARDPKRAQTTPSGSVDGDIMIYEGHTILFQVDPELTFIVIGGADENEMVLQAVLVCLIESLQQLLKVTTGVLDKRLVLDHYDILMLVLDEIVDDGVILETSSVSITTEIQPFVMESSADGAKKALNSINKYLKQNM